MTAFVLNGAPVTVTADHPHLLAALREELDVTSPKDGCSPSGQCGCCTVLIDGKAQVSCQYPTAKAEGRQITTVEGLADEERACFAEAFAASLPADVEGNIVNLLDQRIWRPTPAYFSYQITKSALYVATETLALALAPRIRVNGIAPGPVLSSARQTAEHFAQQVERLPLRRAPDLADFGRTIRYIVANRSITGQVIALDGGQHLGP